MKLEVVYPEYKDGIKTGKDIPVFYAILTDQEMQTLEFIAKTRGRKLRVHTNKHYKCIAANNGINQLEKFFKRKIKREIIVVLGSMEMHGGIKNGIKQVKKRTRAQIANWQMNKCKIRRYVNEQQNILENKLNKFNPFNKYNMKAEFKKAYKTKVSNDHNHWLKLCRIQDENIDAFITNLLNPITIITRNLEDKEVRAAFGPTANKWLKENCIGFYTRLNDKNVFGNKFVRNYRTWYIEDEGDKVAFKILFNTN